MARFPRLFVAVSVGLGTVVLATALASPSQASKTATDKIYVYSHSGAVHGTISPSASFTAEVKTGTVRKRLITGKASSNGAFTAALTYDNGVGSGSHNGDTVVVTDKTTGTKYIQAIQLSAVLNEYTGTLVGVARPNAKLTIELGRVFYIAGTVATTSVVADSAGRFRVELSALHTPGPSNGRPPWRGYVARVESRDVANQAIYKTFQTSGPTLNWTLNQGGGGYFAPGDNVVHELWNNGALRASVATVVDADGVPRSNFPVDIIDGDMFRTRYHDTEGIERVIDLHPWNFTAVVDVANRAVSGVTEPNAPVSGLLKYSTGAEVVVKTKAAADGTYRLVFDSMEWGTMLMMRRVADDGWTGIGVQGLTVQTPIIEANDLTGTVSGYGAPGAAQTAIVLRRSGQVVESTNTTTNRPGKFTATLASEILPGDIIDVTTGSFALPTLDTGSAFTAHHRTTTATSPMDGLAPAGSGVRVASSTCVERAVAGSTGTWSASGCAYLVGDLLYVTRSAIPGVNLGSTIGRYRWASAPDVALSAPAPGASISGPVTLTASSFDHDDNKAPSEVQFFVDGKGVAIDTTAPYSVTVTLAAGTHKVWAVALDSARRLNANGKVIAANTPTRSITVS